MTLEPSRILTFHPGHCYLQQEGHQQVDFCSSCPYPVVVPMLLSLYIMLPYAFEVQFVHGVACLPDNNQANLVVPVCYTFLVTWIVFGGLMETQEFRTLVCHANWVSLVMITQQRCYSCTMQTVKPISIIMISLSFSHSRQWCSLIGIGTKLHLSCKLG